MLNVLVSCFLLLFLSPIVSALTDEDVALVFPSSSTDLASLTSTTVRFREYDISLVANTSHVLILLNKTDSTYENVGWFGHGVGTTMGNGDLYVIWPNSDDTWTISHRSPAAHVYPTPITSSEGLITVIPSLTTNSTSQTSWTAVSFIRPLSFEGVENYGTTSTNVALQRATGQRLLYAYGDANPQSSSPTATIRQHDDFGGGSADLSTAYVPASSSNDGSEDGDGGSSNEPQVITAGWNSFNRLVVAHAVFGGIAVMILSPAAILIGRYFRNKKWFPIHRAIQFASGAFIIIAFALGVAAVNKVDGGIWDDTHHRLGLFLFIFVMLQIFLGMVAHRIKITPGSSRGAIRWFHIIFGITIAALGYTQVYLGFDEWKNLGSFGMTPPDGVRIVFWILVGTQIVAYFVGIGLFRHSFLGRRSLEKKEYKEESSDTPAGHHYKEATSSSYV